MIIILFQIGGIKLLFLPLLLLTKSYLKVANNLFFLEKSVFLQRNFERK